MFVKLKAGWPGTFGRSVPGTNPPKRLTFEPGEVVEIVEEADIKAISSDLGKALVEVEWSDEHRKYVPVAPKPAPQPVIEEPSTPAGDEESPEADKATESAQDDEEESELPRSKRSKK